MGPHADGLDDRRHAPADGVRIGQPRAVAVVEVDRGEHPPRDVRGRGGLRERGGLGEHAPDVRAGPFLNAFTPSPVARAVRLAQRWTPSSGSSDRDTRSRREGSRRKARVTAGPDALAARAAAREPRLRSCTSTARSTSCGAAPIRSTGARPSRCWPRACGRRSGTRVVLVTEGGGYALRPVPAGSLDARPLRGALSPRARRARERRARGRRRRRCGRRSRCGAARRWRMSATSASPTRDVRLEDLRLACLADRLDADIGLRAATRGWWASSRRSCSSTRCASGCAASSCSPSTAPGARPTRWTRIAARTSARRRAGHRALARAARARGRDPAPGHAGAGGAHGRRARPRRAARVTCVVPPLAHPPRAGPDPESLRARLERDHDAFRAVSARHGGSVVRAARRRRAARVRDAGGARGRRAARVARVTELRGEAPLALRVGTGDVLPRPPAVRRGRGRRRAARAGRRPRRDPDRRADLAPGAPRRAARRR